MTDPDSEGYGVDNPAGLAVLYGYWDDLASVMKEAEVTFAINKSYLDNHAKDTDAMKSRDAMFQGGSFPSLRKRSRSVMRIN